MANKPNKATFMKAANPAEAAKILGHTDGGKRLRSRLRSLGVKVSQGGAFDATAKNQLWAIFAEGKQVAKKAKQTSGGNSKQRRTRARKEKATADSE
jgi:hypothetical protein